MNRLRLCRNNSRKSRTLSSNNKSQGRFIKMISSTYVCLFPAINDHPRKSGRVETTWTWGFFPMKNRYFSVAREHRSILLPSSSPPRRYNLPRTVVAGLIDGSVGSSADSLLPSLPQPANILDTSLAGTYYNGCLGFPGARARWPGLPRRFYARGTETARESQSCRVERARGRRPCANYLRFPATGANWIPRWIELCIGRPSGILALFNDAFNGHSDQPGRSARLTPVWFS